VQTDKIDTIYQDIIPVRDSVYINTLNKVSYEVPQESYSPFFKKNYFYEVPAQLKIEGTESSSSITLLKIHTNDYTESEELEKDSLIMDFEQYFINKLNLEP
jgi:hypothetical protein